MCVHMDQPTNPHGGVVLCGGLSHRMGRAKADLPFGAETMLQRVVRLLSQVVSPIVVVAAREQSLPDLDNRVIVARDRLPSAGPLEGIAVGLAAFPTQTKAAYVTSCDVPFLSMEFVQMLFDRLADNDVVVPFDAQHLHPLAAVYRTSLVQQIELLLAAECRRPRQLFQQVSTLQVATTDLRVADPELGTLMNLNHPADYRAALQRERLSIPDWLE